MTRVSAAPSRGVLARLNVADQAVATASQGSVTHAEDTYGQRANAVCGCYNSQTVAMGQGAGVSASLPAQGAVATLTNVITIREQDALLRIPLPHWGAP